MNKKVLVLGGSGFIGKAITKALLDDSQWDLYATYNSGTSPLDARKSFKLDLSHLEEFAFQLKALSPDIIISCMRGNFELQLSLHHEVAEFLKTKDGRIYFFSTANVFDKDKSKVHFETDHTSSNSPYGQFKIKCETLLQQKLGENACIIRLPQVWGKSSPRLNQLKAAAQNGIDVTVYPNLFISTVTDDLIAQCMSYLLANDLKGIFHITASDVISYKSFYQNIILSMGLENISLIDDAKEEGYFAIASEKINQLPECFNQTNQDMISKLCT